MIDIFAIANVLTAIGTIAGTLLGVYKIIDKLTLNRLKNIERKISNLHEWNLKQQKDILNAAEEKQIMMSSIMICLKSLESTNPEIHKTIYDIEKFLYENSHRTISH